MSGYLLREMSSTELREHSNSSITQASQSPFGADDFKLFLFNLKVRLTMAKKSGVIIDWAVCINWLRSCRQEQLTKKLMPQLVRFVTEDQRALQERMDLPGLNNVASVVVVVDISTFFWSKDILLLGVFSSWDRILASFLCDCCDMNRVWGCQWALDLLCAAATGPKIGVFRRWWLMLWGNSKDRDLAFFLGVVRHQALELTSDPWAAKALSR